MTVIAAKDRTMAADGMVVVGGRKYRAIIPKITRVPDGGLVGLSGCVADCRSVAELVTHGMDFTRLPRVGEEEKHAFSALWMKVDSSLWGFDKTFILCPVSNPYAIGEDDAAQFTEALMIGGYGAEAALTLAIEHNIYIGLPVQIENL